MFAARKRTRRTTSNCGFRVVPTLMGMRLFLPLLLAVTSIWNSRNAIIVGFNHKIGIDIGIDIDTCGSVPTRFFVADAFSPSSSRSPSFYRSVQRWTRTPTGTDRLARPIPIAASRSALTAASDATDAGDVASESSDATAIATNKNNDKNNDRNPSNLPKTRATEDRSVEVWDGVFSAEVCEYLHELAIDHSERTTDEEGDYYDDDEDDLDDDNDNDNNEELQEDQETEDEEDDSLDGSSVFVHLRANREQHATQDQLTPLEQALDSFLEAYYESHPDTAPTRDVVVEYWCRQEHLNLEAHADVDEVFFERWCKNRKLQRANHATGDAAADAHAYADADAFRYPTFGHVLYLTVPTLGRGPTCVFPPSDRDQATIADEIASVVTIPSIPGRVLRFPGSALHAVPKPADVWFSATSHCGEETNDDDDNDNESDGEEEDWDYDDDYDDDDDERSVVLFNTWYATADDDDDDKAAESSASQGPIGVHPDPMFRVQSDAELVEMMMSSADIADSGVEVDEAFVKGMVEYARQQKADRLESWREKFGGEADGEGDGNDNDNDTPVVYSAVRCQPRNTWKLAPIHVHSDEVGGGDDDDDDYDATTPSGEGAVPKDGATIRVPLMGDALRRRYPQKKVRWVVPTSFRDGVNDPHRPFRFSVEPVKTIQSQNNC